MKLAAEHRLSHCKTTVTASFIPCLRIQCVLQIECCPLTSWHRPNKSSKTMPLPHGRESK